ncbi:hypothetical protein IFR04_005844 [Cadophora malorum]|uniref:Mid2 domain-containing protein n=1 Tax=Cadophora malorum TaxID=108018 RepID=A0A8H7TG22_9HELO|nr:hypothetical protein IFR04_005844 [Cadophora malorum]
MFASTGWRDAILLGLVGGSLGSRTGIDAGRSDDDAWMRSGDQRVVQEQRISLPTQTVRSTIIVSYPKITDGPSLVRRKLGSIKWDMIHDGIQGQKRDLTSCPVDYDLCPKSMNGGCCPTDRVCGTSSCFPNSAAPASACGKSGYIACGIPEGGGCCPGGYQCATNGCILLAGVVQTAQTCGTDSYLCPASLGNGCCSLGLGCAISSCYKTDISIFTYTGTVTTTDANLNPHTLTTTITSSTVLGAPDPTETVNDDGVRGKYIPPETASEKVKAEGAKNSGLTTSQIGGIIGGAVVILLIILLASFLIIKRLNRAIRLSESNTHTHSSSSGHRSRRSVPRPQDIDAMSVDPLMMTPSEASGSVRRPYHSRNPSSTTYELDVDAHTPRSTPTFTSPFTPRSPPNTHYRDGYNAVSSSESQYSSSSGGGGYRNPSVESTQPMHHNPNAGYFDLPLQTQIQHEHRNSQTSQISPQTQTGRRPSQHGRNLSDTSDISQISQTSSAGLAELDASPDTARRSSVTRSILQGLGMGRIASRRRSETVPLSGGPVRSPDWTPSPREGLFHIPEAGESAVRIEGVREGVDSALGGMSNAQFREISLLDSGEGTFGPRRGLSGPLYDPYLDADGDLGDGRGRGRGRG